MKIGAALFLKFFPGNIGRIAVIFVKSSPVFRRGEFIAGFVSKFFSAVFTGAGSASTKPLHIVVHNAVYAGGNDFCQVFFIGGFIGRMIEAVGVSVIVLENPIHVFPFGVNIGAEGFFSGTTVYLGKIIHSCAAQYGICLGCFKEIRKIFQILVGLPFLHHFPVYGFISEMGAMMLDYLDSVLVKGLGTCANCFNDVVPIGPERISEVGADEDDGCNPILLVFLSIFFKSFTIPLKNLLCTVPVPTESFVPSVGIFFHFDTRPLLS